MEVSFHQYMESRSSEHVFGKSAHANDKSIPLISSLDKSTGSLTVRKLDNNHPYRLIRLLSGCHALKVPIYSWQQVVQPFIATEY